MTPPREGGIDFALRVMATVVLIIAVVLFNIWFWPHVWNR